MTTITSKVCIVGDFAVGKTSVTERFVSNHFSDKYLTTVGVKIDTKEVELPDFGVSQKLVIWDVAGSDSFGATQFAYLRGAAGYLFVADGTRPETVGAMRGLRDQIDVRADRRAHVLLINKSDLATEWAVDDARIDELREEFGDMYLTSAKTGDNVEAAFHRLAELITANEFDGVS